jgi:hypothetical protein
LNFIYGQSRKIKTLVNSRVYFLLNNLSGVSNQMAEKINVTSKTSGFTHNNTIHTINPINQIIIELKNFILLLHQDIIYIIATGRNKLKLAAKTDKSTTSL